MARHRPQQNAPPARCGRGVVGKSTSRSDGTLFGWFVSGDDALFVFFARGAFDARFDEAIQHLDDDAALLFLDAWNRAATHRRRNLLKRESRRCVYPLRSV